MRGVTVPINGCINAVSNSITPLIIFPCVHFENHILIGAQLGIYGTSHPSGWLDGDKFLELSSASALNHDSYIKIPAISICRENDVIMLTFLPHTSLSCTHLIDASLAHLRNFTMWRAATGCSATQRNLFLFTVLCTSLAYPSAFQSIQYQTWILHYSSVHSR